MEHDHHHAAPDIPAGTETAKDLVCGMTVAVKPDGRHADFADHTFQFCSEKCQTKFKADPWFYASGRAAGQKNAAPANVQYTCPMHPEIVRDAPGACPICGMALEPMVPSDEPSEELTDFTRRMWISAAAAVPLIILTMGELVAWQGQAEIGRKAKWPGWQPTANTIHRQPEKYARYANGVAGGPDNPLGSRALYLYRDDRDTMYRIHGTTESWTIGQAVSNGCIRLINEHVEDLYERVQAGAQVIVR